VRVAEALTVLPFLTRAAIPGLYIGCLLANTFGAQGWHDIVIGPLVTLAAAALTRLVGRLSRSTVSALLAALPIIFMWGGALYFLTSFKMTWGTAVGSVLSIVCLLVMTFAVIRQSDNTSSRASVLILKLLSIIIAAVSIVLLRITSDIYFVVFGTLLLIAALLVAMFLVQFWIEGKNPNVLIAPLPPVVFNAFGVSLYLAPLYGYDYWFSVQMVGVGQLIACYLIGLPVLMALRKRKIFG
jgi:uncharacterized membrane protein